MVLEGLASKEGTLIEVVSSFDTGTIQHSDEITIERRCNGSLGNERLVTADFPMYTVEYGQAILYLARGKDSLILMDAEEAAWQMGKGDDHVIEKGQTVHVLRNGVMEPVDFLENMDIRRVRESESTLRIPLLERDLEQTSPDTSYFRIDTAGYGRFGPVQRALAERHYGQGKEFGKSMKMLRQNGAGWTMIYVLSPGYVRNHPAVREGGAIARLCWLDSLRYRSCFGANGGYADGRVRMRGRPAVYK